MQSMTGFGSAQREHGAQRVGVQIASVNHRGCRVSVRADLRDLGLEERIRKQVQQALQRGSITVQIAVTAADADADWDVEALRRRWRSLATLAEELGAPAPRLEEVLRLQSAKQTGGLDEKLVEAVLATVDEALTQCASMRAVEGAALAETFTQRRDVLVDLRGRIATAAAGRVERHAERLHERLAELLRDRAGIEEAAIVRELAVYADRIAIDEELDRLDSHLDQLAGLVAEVSGQGKRMEFLLQEIGRELNTTGAKANDADLQKLVVEGKAVLEQMREQVANVL